MFKFLDAYYNELRFLGFATLLTLTFMPLAWKRKSPGQLLYERSILLGRFNGRPWKDVDPMIREAWEKTAKEGDN